mgnify:CR=1 FL=1|jgi:copper chaperone CopZ
MNNLCLNVSGIANEQMKTSLKNALEKIDGVQSIEVDRATDTVMVGFNDPADETQIKDCVENTGYTVS